MCVILALGVELHGPQSVYPNTKSPKGPYCISYYIHVWYLIYLQLIIDQIYHSNSIGPILVDNIVWIVIKFIILWKPIFMCDTKINKCLIRMCYQGYCIMLTVCKMKCTHNKYCDYVVIMIKTFTILDNSQYR